MKLSHAMELEHPNEALSCVCHQPLLHAVHFATRCNLVLCKSRSLLQMGLVNKAGSMLTWLLPPCQQSICGVGGVMGKIQQGHVLQSDLCVRSLRAELHLCSELLQITGSHPLCLLLWGTIRQDDTG